MAIFLFVIFLIYVDFITPYLSRFLGRLEDFNFSSAFILFCYLSAK
jgi:hypothetical protein